MATDCDKLNFKLPVAILDFQGEELIAAGSVLDDAVINDIVVKGRQKNFANVSLLQHGELRADLIRYMCATPYQYMFGGPEGVMAHLEKIGEIPVPAPVLNALDNFREHDFYTYRHSLLVFALTTFMMDYCDAVDTPERDVLLVGPTHDLGKLSVPISVLTKKTPLTRKERFILECHPVAGYVLNSYYLGDTSHPAAQVALNHHERKDGSGYPRGISDVDPLVEMVSACDVYDALISTRPYRPTDYDNRSALEEITALAEEGTLSWHCVHALIGRNRKGYPAAKKVKIAKARRGISPPDNCYGVFVEE